MTAPEERTGQVSTAFAETRRAILENKALGDAIKFAAGRSAPFIPNAGNLGDALLNLGTFDFFDEIGWNPDVLSANYTPEDLTGRSIIVLGGGGGWKEGLWEQHARHLRPFLESGGELIVLPSTIDGFREYFSRYHGQITLFVRERTSAERLAEIQELSGRVHLCPDMGFAVSQERFERFAARRGSGQLAIFRSDEESVKRKKPRTSVDIPILWNGFDWRDAACCVAPLLAAAELISQFEIIETDRLHMSILSAMLERTVIMYGNSYYKNRSIYEYTLSDKPNVSFRDDADEHQAELFSDSETNSATSADISHAGQEGRNPLEQEFIALARLRREYFEPELQRLNAAIAEYERTKTEWYEPELKRLTEALAGAEKARKEHYEPELQRLKQQIADLTDAHRQLEIDKEALMKKLSRDEVPLLQRRLMYHAEQARKLGDVFGALEARLAEANRLRDSWYVPEIVRLSEIIQSHEKTKKEWFEPQLQSRAAYIEQLEAQVRDLRSRLDSMAGFERSRSFRIWRKVRRLLKLG